jgi:hypothetical protein
MKLFRINTNKSKPFGFNKSDHTAFLVELLILGKVMFGFSTWQRERFGKLSRGYKFKLFGVRIGFATYPIFQRQVGGALRRVIQGGLRTRSRDLSVLYQRYSPGYELHKHIDGPQDNHVLSILLKRPQAGGEFQIEGPHRRFFRDRVMLFNGGRNIHGVTKVEGTHRSILMFQACRRFTAGVAVLD